MGYLEVANLSYKLVGGRILFDDVSFAVREGQHAALVGANGVGKTTLLRVLAGEDRPSSGAITLSGEPGYMPQLVGSIDDSTAVRDLFVSLAPKRIRDAAAALARAEDAVRLPHGRGADERFAHALAGWGEAGGYESEVLWDICSSRAVGLSFDECAHRPVRTFSGGEQKKLALEALLRSDRDVLLLDEPDNFLDIAGKRELERAVGRSDKTILFVSHDREILARTADRIVTLEAHASWAHEGSFETYPDARAARVGRIEELQRRHAEHRKRLVALVKKWQLVKSPKTKAAWSRLERHDATPPPERAAEQRIRMDLGGGRTGRRAVAVKALGVPSVFDAFDGEVEFGERVGVIGPNGTGKTHFLRLLAGHDVPHEGSFSLGSRVVAGYFSQTHDDHEVASRRVREILAAHGLDRGASMTRLRRYELHECYDQPFDTLSGGQQARLQILLLELSGSTLLLLDEPTDNLDVASAEALEDALASYEGTVIAVTHDRWFMRSFERFLLFDDDGNVGELLESPY